MKRILVVAAVIRRDGKILIAQRPLDKHQGGLWEFPGGKVEEGEPAAAALVRELEEELGITPRQYRPLIRLRHDYPDKAICLDVWEVSAFTGAARGREGQPVRWVSTAALPRFEFPAANRAIVAALRLPSLYFITPEGLDAAGYMAWLEARLQRQAGLVLLRAPRLPEPDYLALARDFLAHCHAAGAKLMLHGDPARLQQVEADGVHMPAMLLDRFAARPCSPGCWLAASVHDLRELQRAEAIGVDFATLSPLRPTLSHPEAVALGWENFAALVEHAPMPVYALGGVGAEDLEQAWRAGAQGVAGIRGL
ncbi:MAG: Nudix family hydrolase [Pseudomonadota bacterium]